MKDIHLHLSGSCSPRALYEVIKDSGYKIGVKNYREFVDSINLAQSGGFDAYLSILHKIDLAQSSPMAIKACVYDSFVSSYLNGADHLELRFNPTKRSANGAIDLDSIILAAKQGYELANSRFGIEGGLILCMGWDCTTNANEAILNKAIKYKTDGVLGIDIAGPYALATNEQRSAFAKMYRIADSHGLITTAHAGEIDHPELSVELDWFFKDLRPQRVGHGIKILNNKEYIQEAKRLGLLFEICISSNVATKAVTGVHEFKNIFKTLIENELKYQICTDATYGLNTNIMKEYELHRSLMEE